jgi:hypothetical protein
LEDAALMRDLLSRLLDALPQVQTWMAELHAKSEAHSVPASETAFTRLGEYFPLAVLERARAVMVDAIPFPPVRSLGLPEFEAMAAMPMDGITFGHMYFLRQENASEALHFHELVHVVQWSALGVQAFLPTYAVGFAQHGYEDSPLESMALALQSKFERGHKLPDLVGFISWDAEQARKSAEDFFRSVGMQRSNNEMKQTSPRWRD